MTRSRGDAGFSLAEMLVALALMAMILGLFGSFLMTLQKVTHAVAGIEEAENVEVVRRLLLESLESARAPPRDSRNGAREIAFRGEPSRIAFAQVLQGEHEIGGVYETTVWLADNGDLLLTRRPLGWRMSGAAASQRLLANVDELAFAYYPCSPSSSLRGTRRWNDREHLPWRISVAVTFRRGDTGNRLEVSAFPPAASCLPGP